MQLKIVVLPGDGVGPEVTEQAVFVLREIANIHGHNFQFAEHVAGGSGESQRSIATAPASCSAN